MFVEELFKISKSVIEDVEKHPYKFGFDGFGELVYYTNYSRLLQNGVQEKWIDTCIRTVEGVFSIRKSWYKIHSLKWDEQHWDSIASELLYFIYTLKVLPPGRGLWAQGTDYVYKNGSMALNNCAASLIKAETFAEDLGWVMDALMCGAGVGVRPVPPPYPRLAFVHSLRVPSTYIKTMFAVADSREGWVESVIALINSYRKTHNDKGRPLVFDYSAIRKEGTRIKGFGGTASGPKPLIILHSRIREYMDSFITKGGDYTYTLLTANISNAIGACIIAGNVRRGAELILGSPYDDTFKNLSDYEKFPERAEIGWMSNNSYALETKNDFTKIDDIANSICEKGEGGLANFKNIKKYSRFGDTSAPDNANCVNPCLHEHTIVIRRTGGSTCIKDIKIGDVIWSKEGWTTVLAVYNNGIKSVYRYKTKAGSIDLTEKHKIINGTKKIQAKDAFSLDGLRKPFRNDYYRDSLRRTSDVVDDFITKTPCSITSKVYLEEAQVYDITVDNSTHTFWANGFDVSNCSEIPIYNKGLCNLFEVYPSKAKNIREFLKMCRLAAFYTTTVSLLPTHNEETNQVIVKNRRVGVSLSGVADWFDNWGSRIVRFMRSGYSEVKDYATYLNAEAGVAAPIRVTTVKPSGSVSQLSGVSPGMHFPIFAPYALRRMRISKTSPVLQLCEQAGLSIDVDVNNSDTTRIVEFPIHTGTTRSSDQVSAWEQFSLLALLQREWSDNMVSCTIHFTEKEKKDIPRMLSYFLPVIKSASFLLKDDTKYPQMPYEKISEKEYLSRTSKVSSIDWTKFGNSDGKESKFCTNDSCEI